ncbi:MAG: DUF1573 domain-containing protein [Candidatus Aminicenantes bacterium]|nr:DUF1573 domain-containing protein [Candidatus Aminicenantes bacterium]
MNPMRARRIVLIALLALTAAASFAAPGAAKGPKIAFKEDAWNFGRAKMGADLVHEFAFKNEGDATLKIINVETSCGCTAALVSDKKVEPGKSGKIKVTFSTQGYAGEVVKYIYVETDDPVQPRVQLKITAAVDVPPQPRIDFDRYSFDGGLLVEGDSLVAPITVYNKGELELRFECQLTGAQVLFAGKPAAYPIKVAAGKSVELVIKMDLANRMGPIREFALFKSNDPLRSTISVNLNGYIVTKEQLRQVFQKYKDLIK